MDRTMEMEKGWGGLGGGGAYKLYLDKFEFMYTFLYMYMSEKIPNFFRLVVMSTRRKYEYLIVHPLHKTFIKRGRSRRRIKGIEQNRRN